MITYNDLYDVLRKEKYNDNLQSLPKNFIDDFVSYLNDKKDSEEGGDDLFADSVAKSKKQFENAISLFKELMLRRKKKLLNLVFVATETGIMKRDYENMLAHERKVFDNLVKSFEEGDKELSVLLSGKKQKERKQRMVLFTQDISEFVDHRGGVVGPFASGEIANLDIEAAEILVSGGKASYVDED